MAWKNLRLPNQRRVKHWNSSTRYIWNPKKMTWDDAVDWLMIRYDKVWTALAAK